MAPGNTELYGLLQTLDSAISALRIQVDLLLAANRLARVGDGGSVTPSLSGLNPSTPGIVSFSGCASNVTVDDLAGGVLGQVVTLVNEDATHTVTLGLGNTRLVGGTPWVGSQFDTIVLVLGATGRWYELSRSANAVPP